MALGPRFYTPALLVLDPDVQHPRVPVALVPDVGVGHGLRPTAEVQLEVLIGDLGGGTEVNERPALQQKRPVAEPLECPHVMGHEYDRLPGGTHRVEYVEA